MVSAHLFAHNGLFHCCQAAKNVNEHGRLSISAHELHKSAQLFCHNHQHFVIVLNLLCNTGGGGEATASVGVVATRCADCAKRCTYQPGMGQARLQSVQGPVPLQQSEGHAWHGCAVNIKSQSEQGFQDGGWVLDLLSCNCTAKLLTCSVSSLFISSMRREMPSTVSDAILPVWALQSDVLASC